MAIRFREGRKAPWIVYWKNPFSGKTEEEAHVSEKEAKKANSLIKHRLKYERESFRLADEKAVPEENTLEACYYLYLKEKNFTPKSLLWQLDAMKIALSLLGQKPVAIITRAELQNVLFVHMQSGVKPVTVRGRMSVLRTVIRWCAEKGFIDQIPIFPKLPAAHYEHFIPPTPAEVSAICSVAQPHIVRVALLGAQLGVRVGPSELMRMEWSNIDFVRGVARIVSAKKRPKQPWREIPIRRRLLEMMLEWRESDLKEGIVYIIHYNGQKVQSVKRSWATALKKAGIERRIRPYDLRHAFATEAISSGVDIKTAAEIMGDDPKMLLEHYQHVSSEQKRAAVEALPEIQITAKNYGKEKEGRSNTL
jgi:integrase